MSLLADVNKLLKKQMKKITQFHRNPCELISYAYTLCVIFR